MPPRSSPQVPRLCDIGSRALKAALASIDTSAAGTSAVPSAAAHNVVSHVLSITKHLMAQMAAAAAAKQASSAAAQGGRGEGRNGLEHRLDAEMDDPSGSGAAADAAAVAAMAHLDGLVTQVSLERWRDSLTNPCTVVHNSIQLPIPFHSHLY